MGRRRHVTKAAGALPTAASSADVRKARSILAGEGLNRRMIHRRDDDVTICNIRFCAKHGNLLIPPNPAHRLLLAP